MLRLLRVNAADPVPIWSQIEEGVRRLVASSALAPGASVPSVRDLARKIRVNPATVSKAYQRLTTAGVLEVRRGDGTYVASAPPPLLMHESARLPREGAVRLASLAMTLGAKQDEALEALRSVWASLEQAKGEKQ